MGTSGGQNKTAKKFSSKLFQVKFPISVFLCHKATKVQQISVFLSPSLESRAARRPASGARHPVPAASVRSSVTRMTKRRRMRTRRRADRAWVSLTYTRPVSTHWLSDCQTSKCPDKKELFVPLDNYTLMGGLLCEYPNFGSVCLGGPKSFCPFLFVGVSSWKHYLSS